MGKEKQATDSNSAIKRCECGETYRQLSYTNERTFCRWTVVECNNMRHACVCAWPKTRSTKHIHSASSFSVAQNEWNSVSFRAYGCLARWALFHSKLSGIFLSTLCISIILFLSFSNKSKSISFRIIFRTLKICKSNGFQQMMKKKKKSISKDTLLSMSMFHILFSK